MIDTQLINSDCLAAMKNMGDNSVDAIVTDPPYGLSFMGKKWDYDVPSKEIWLEALRVLKPGGHLLSFSGSRTYHRMVVNIEDAGFEIRDQIMWIYGSGFPKSLNISKAIDKAAGVKREVIGENPLASKQTGQKNTVALAGDRNTNLYLTKPATSEAKKWDGWGTALKPAHEPIVVARKPIHSTVVENVLEHGTGAINIGECRVGNEILSEHTSGNIPNNRGEWGLKEGYTMPERTGRFPANVILDEEAGAILDEQSGISQSSDAVRKNKREDEKLTMGGKIHAKEGSETHGFKDKGGASRFFYCAKASKAERDAGLEAFESKKSQLNSGGIGRKISVEKRLKEGEENAPTMKNIHPTVKPIRLMQYLCRLVTPKNGIVLDPFMGSGTTGIAANLEGFNFIGIEMDEEYVEIARARIAHSGDYVIGEDLVMKRIKQPTLFDFAV